MNSNPKPNLPADIKPDEKNKTGLPGAAGQPNADPKKEDAK